VPSIAKLTGDGANKDAVVKRLKRLTGTEKRGIRITEAQVEVRNSILY